jgi:Lar family restriction alleviation protein
MAKKISDLDKEFLKNLKPCPFCGNRKFEFINKAKGKTIVVYYPAIRCKSCQAQSGHFANKGMVKVAWNRRVNS